MLSQGFDPAKQPRPSVKGGPRQQGPITVVRPVVLEASAECRIYLISLILEDINSSFQGSGSTWNFSAKGRRAIG